MNIEIIRYRLPVYWACPLIDDDYAGLTDKECEEIKHFLEAAEGYPVDVDWETQGLYDLDNVGDDGVLIKPLEEIPCPFCRTEEFIRYDPFNKEYSMDSEEDIKDWYMSYINEMRNKYGGK